MRVGMIGAGIAGLSCATALTRQGHEVVLFDKGRGAGGRMSTRRLATHIGEAAFDHGAQYFTARDPRFIDAVESWADAGHAARWPTAGDDAWVGVPAMNAPVRSLASELDVRWATRIDRIERGESWRFHGDTVLGDCFDAAVVAIPAEQVASLVEAESASLAALARATPSDPCWTVMVAYDGRVPLQPGRIVGRSHLSSVIRNNAKPGRTGPEAWVLQADADWSRAHLEDEPATVEAAILAMFAGEVGVDMPTVTTASAHRWRYAKSGALERGAIWLADTRLGVCGDWLLASRVEAAWLSGLILADLMS